MRRFLEKAFAIKPGRARSTKQASRQRGVQPRLEPLEDRQLLSASPLVSAPALHSNPGAPNSLWLDFNGLPAQDWGWSGPAKDAGTVIGSAAGGAVAGPVGSAAGGALGGFLAGKAFPQASTPVFHLDGGGTTFTATEAGAIKEIWARVAEDYAPFNVDVTTVAPANYNDSNGPVVRVSIGGSGSWVPTWFPGGRPTDGIGLPDSLHLPHNHIAFVFSDFFHGDVEAMANTASHEAGHVYGLYHQSDYDAQGHLVNEYSAGPGYKAPIMGDVADGQRGTWWHGRTDLNGIPFVGAGNYQDDMAVLASRLGVRDRTANGEKPHQYSNVATPLTYDAASHKNVGHGILETTSDHDYYSFDTNGGPVVIQLKVARFDPASSDLWVAPASPGAGSVVANLAAKLQLYDDYGNLVEEDNSPIHSWEVGNDGGLGVTIQRNLPGGHYFLVVRSHDPVRDASGNLTYDNYGDVGKYTVTEADRSAPLITGVGVQRQYHSYYEPMSLQVTFNNAIDPGTFNTSNIVLTDASGNAVRAADLTIRQAPLAADLPDSAARNFILSMPAVPRGGYHLTLRTGITDLFGNGLAAAYASNLNVPGPQVSSDMADGRQSIRVTFSQQIEPSTFATGSLNAVVYDTNHVQMGITAIQAVDSAHGVFDLLLSRPLVGGYDLTVGPGVLNLWGVPMAQAYHDSVRDTTPPWVGGFARASSGVPGGSQALAVQNLVVAFNKAIDWNSFTAAAVEVRDPSGHLVTGVSVGEGGSLLFPGAPAHSTYVISFAPSGFGDYTLLIKPQVTDFFGNALDQRRSNPADTTLQQAYTTHFRVDAIIPSSGLGSSSLLLTGGGLQVINPIDPTQLGAGLSATTVAGGGVPGVAATGGGVPGTTVAGVGVTGATLAKGAVNVAVTGPVNLKATGADGGLFTMM